MKRYYFISGLPRSGSTLLSSILRQNPDFYTDISSPVSGVFDSIINNLSLCENSINIDDNCRANSLLGFINGYYKEINQTFIFDTNKTWTCKTTLVKKLFPYTKIICCVRDIAWILDSLERISNFNPMYYNTMVDEESLSSVYTRCDSFMNPTKGGLLYKSLKWLEEGLAINPESILLIEYDQLCRSPEQEIRKIYNFLNLEYYNHNFSDVEYKNDSFDLFVGMKDLHTVRKKVELVNRKSVLPERLWDQYNCNMEFWRSKNEFKYG